MVSPPPLGKVTGMKCSRYKEMHNYFIQGKQNKIKLKNTRRLWKRQERLSGQKVKVWAPGEQSELIWGLNVMWQDDEGGPTGKRLRQVDSCQYSNQNRTSIWRPALVTRLREEVSVRCVEEEKCISCMCWGHWGFRWAHHHLLLCPWSIWVFSWLTTQRSIFFHIDTVLLNFS